MDRSFCDDRSERFFPGFPIHMAFETLHMVMAVRKHLLDSAAVTLKLTAVSATHIFLLWNVCSLPICSYL